MGAAATGIHSGYCSKAAGIAATLYLKPFCVFFISSFPFQLVIASLLVTAKAYKAQWQNNAVVQIITYGAEVPTADKQIKPGIAVHLCKCRFCAETYIHTIQRVT